MIRLGVNVDHVATIREARGTEYPDPVETALLAESAGADGITAHIRLDRRHINERDVRILREVVKTHLNIEACLDEEIQSFLLEIKPDWVCLVPEREEEVTTEGGLNLKSMSGRIKETTERLRNAGIMVTHFIEPEEEMVELSAELGACAVELNTDSWSKNPFNKEFKRLEGAAQFGVTLGLEVHAGHGLNLRNVGPVASIEEIEELNIGHAIIGRSINVGIERAVSEMKEKMLFGE